MGPSRFSQVLLVSAMLFIFLFSHGFGRMLRETADHDRSTLAAGENAGKWRILIEVMDYRDPEPNTNPKNGYIFSPPSAVPSAPPLA